MSQITDFDRHQLAREHPPEVYRFRRSSVPADDTGRLSEAADFPLHIGIRIRQCGVEKTIFR